MKEIDVIVIGAGISGLTAAALLAKRGRKVALFDAQSKPGGSCGIFKRNGCIFEQGAAMLYGFGETGFNPHRYVFNVLEQPITMIRHKELYTIQYQDKRIDFPDSIPEFVEELGRLFPEEKRGIEEFYRDMEKLYRDVILTTPVFQSPDTLDKRKAGEQVKLHPLSYFRFLRLMNVSVKQLLKRYMKGERILQFFDKLTSTYCYATVAEAPAVLGAVMFVDNHCGGSYYPAGSTLMLTGILEKVIEENGGDCHYNAEVSRILVEAGRVKGIELNDHSTYYADQIIYSGNIWSLYEDLLQIPMKHRYVPTLPSVVYYALVRRQAIPESAKPIEMLISKTDEIADSEITVYVMSKDDMTLCPHDQHVVVAIGPTYASWPVEEKEYHTKAYEELKKKEKERIINVLEQRFPIFRRHIIQDELSTPCTLCHYVKKYKGAVAGPKQMLGQHMLKRQHTRTEIEGLYCCGEGTVMGTGTPAVTVSAIAAANTALKDAGCKEYAREDEKEQYVKIVKAPYPLSELAISNDAGINNLALMARHCDYCEHPSCEKKCPYHIKIRDINRRLAVGNVAGASKLLNDQMFQRCMDCRELFCEASCVTKERKEKVPIHNMYEELKKIK